MCAISPNAYSKDMSLYVLVLMHVVMITTVSVYVLHL